MTTPKKGPHLATFTMNDTKSEILIVILPVMSEPEIRAHLEAALDMRVGRAWDGDQLQTRFYRVASYEEGVAKGALVAAAMGGRVRGGGEFWS